MGFELASNPNAYGGVPKGRELECNKGSNKFGKGRQTTSGEGKGGWVTWG